jgi:hypothetical protein
MSRPEALLVGATITAAIIMVFFFKAPIVPVGIGAVGAAFIILWRSRSSS